MNNHPLNSNGLRELAPHALESSKGQATLPIHALLNALNRLAVLGDDAQDDCIEAMADCLVAAYRLECASAITLDIVGSYISAYLKLLTHSAGDGLVRLVSSELDTDSITISDPCKRSFASALQKAIASIAKNPAPYELCLSAENAGPNGVVFSLRLTAPTPARARAGNHLPEHWTREHGGALCWSARLPGQLVTA